MPRTDFFDDKAMPSTPGPWQYRRMKSHFAIEAADGTRIAEVRFVCRPDGSTSEREARILAASLDMLSALKQVAHSLVSPVPKDANDGLRLLATLDAAIAKAEGK